MRASIITAFFALLIFSCSAATAKKRSLVITEKTKYYSITGKTAADFARSMARNGPYSFQHRRRAWATADRKLTYQLVKQKTKRGCRVTGAKVKLEITYTLPKLANASKVSKRERRKWRKMLNILKRHERTHGLYYKQMAKKVSRSLRRMKPTKTCDSLLKGAARVVEKLGEKNQQLNDRLDARENYRKMSRIYQAS